MQPFAVISDVHSNLEALQAVLARIDQLGIRRVVSLGDVIGYGPDPEACLHLIANRCSVKLLGNHEHGVLHPKQPISFNPAARHALEWTRERITKAGMLDLISELHAEWQEDDVNFVHGTVRNPLHEYLREADSDGYSNFDEIVDSLERDFTDFHVCFIGHNHRPFLATTEGFLHPHDGQRDFHVGKDDKLYLSVGSVGQPRDRDPRACFATFDGSHVVFHRVPYAHEETARKIRAAGLPTALADRLAIGK